MTWSTSTPAGSDSLANGDNIIRELKTDIQTALRGDDTEGVEAVFPGSDTANPIYRYRGLKGTTAARPTAGQYGLYFDTTRKVLQRDNGTTWEDIAGGIGIESGTKMVFYQASAPSGWTAVAVNDKFLRVVTAGGTGGTTGGTVAASTSLAHTHAVASHTHDLGDHTHSTPNHAHSLKYDAGTTPQSVGVTNDNSFKISLESDGNGGRYKLDGTSGSAANVREYVYGGTMTDGAGTSGAPSSNTSGSTSPATDSQLGAFAYADVIVAQKD